MESQSAVCSIWESTRLSRNCDLDVGCSDTDHLSWVFLRSQVTKAVLAPGTFLIGDHFTGTRVRPKDRPDLLSQITTVATSCGVFTMDSRFRSPKFRPYRTTLYTGLGLTGVIFVIHGVLLHGWETQLRRMALDWMAKMACLNLIGAAFYAARVSLPCPTQHGNTNS